MSFADRPVEPQWFFSIKTKQNIHRACSDLASDWLLSFHPGSICFSFSSRVCVHVRVSV